MGSPHEEPTGPQRIDHAWDARLESATAGLRLRAPAMDEAPQPFVFEPAVGDSERREAA